MTVALADHPAARLIEAYALGTLSPVDAAEVEEHLATCDSCCGRLSTVPDDSFVALLRGSASLSVSHGIDSAGEETVLLRDAASCLPSELSLAYSRPDDAAESLPRDVPIPKALVDHPRYRVLEPCGVGGMGVVYRAEHRVMSREVALKVIRPELLRRPQAVDRFRREVQAAAALSHPNIVSAHDAEESYGLHFLVMEYVPGSDLASLVAQRGPLPVRDACDYVLQAAKGLAHAHERGMVHRDIKPQNLMLTPDGRVKILDFGLSKFASEAEEPLIAADKTNSGRPDLTSADASLGTPDYVAPEQAADAHAADIRADIYGLGGTLYFLLAGRPPFPGSSIVEKLRGHAEEAPRPITDFRDDLPPEPAKVLQRMMAKRPEDRYQTPSEVAEALRPFAVDASVEGVMLPAAPPVVPPGGPPQSEQASDGAAWHIQLPAYGLLATAALNLALLAWSVAAWFGTAPFTPPKGEWGRWLTLGPWFALPFTLFVADGALRMARLEDHRKSKLSAWFATLPCTPVWLLGLPIGIWSLIVLDRSDVRRRMNAESAGESSRSPSSPAPPWQGSANGEEFKDARRKVESPANGILAVTVLNLVLGVWSLSTMPHVYPREDLWSIWAAVGGISMIPATLVMMQGALRMRRLESMAWAKAAAIYAVIPWTPIWFLGLPFGLWALWTLGDPTVRRGFGLHPFSPPMRRRGILLTGLVLSLPIGAGTGGIVYIETDKGEIAIEAHDPEARIRVLRDGKVVEILDPVTNESVTVDTGVYTIQLGSSGYTTSLPENDKFLIHRGKRKIVTVRRVDEDKQEIPQASGEQVTETVKVPLVIRYSNDTPPLNTTGVVWDDSADAWKIDGMSGRTVRLYEAALPGEEGRGIDDRLLIYRAKLKTRDVTGRAYLEMWIRAANGQKYFSRGFDDAVRGTTDWVQVQTPFVLKEGETADQAQLNLVIEGGGTVWIKDIELEAKPRPKTPAERFGEWIKGQLRSEPSSSADHEELDRLVELAEEKLQRVQGMHETATATRSQVREAEQTLLEAKIRRAEARGDREDAVRGLQRVVKLAEEHLAQIQALYGIGATPMTEVWKAERRLLEEQIRLAELKGAQQEKIKRLRRIVQLAEERLAGMQELSEQGVVPQSELNAAQKALLEARLRLKAAEESREDRLKGEIEDQGVPEDSEADRTDAAVIRMPRFLFTGDDPRRRLPPPRPRIR